MVEAWVVISREFLHRFYVFLASTFFRQSKINTI
nr:MAG TPA: hypothetical protein [Caudoviricetes sp.]DAL57452.1 MAG TPA_asm: hypothetical protein [Caudoviricetes sp.]